MTTLTLTNTALTSSLTSLPQHRRPRPANRPRRAELSPRELRRIVLDLLG